MITKGSRIYIAHKHVRDSGIIECDVTNVDMHGRIHFDVVNGLWEGYYDPAQEIIYVKYTREKYPSEIIYSGPRVKGGDYNERIDRVIKHVRENGIVPGAAVTTVGHPPTRCLSDVCMQSGGSDTGDAKTSKSNAFRSDLRTVNVSSNSYLVIDKTHNEVRLFKKHNKRNHFIRSMSLGV